MSRRIGLLYYGYDLTFVVGELGLRAARRSRTWASVGIVLDNAPQRLQRCGLFLCPTPLSKLKSWGIKKAPHFREGLLSLPD